MTQSKGYRMQSLEEVEPLLAHRIFFLVILKPYIKVKQAKSTLIV